MYAVANPVIPAPMIPTDSPMMKKINEGILGFGLADDHTTQASGYA
jgi:hypothetical protein